MQRLVSIVLVTLALSLAGCIPSGSDAKASDNLPSWVRLDEERYPCPEGTSRIYSHLSSGVWKLECS